MRVLIIDDDEAICELLTYYLKSDGFTPVAVHTGKAGRQFLQQEAVDAVLLDWHLPDADGLQVLDMIRADHGWSLPVIFITSRTDEADVVTALQRGADDFMPKPVNRKVLQARLQAAIRRYDGKGTHTVDPVLVECPPYRFAAETHSVSVHNKTIALTDTEYSIASLLFFALGGTVTLDQLKRCWKSGSTVADDEVHALVSKVYRALDIGAANGYRLTPIYRVGYRLERAPAVEARAT